MDPRKRPENDRGVSHPCPCSGRYFLMSSLCFSAISLPEVGVHLLVPLLLAGADLGVVDIADLDVIEGAGCRR